MTLREQYAWAAGFFDGEGCFSIQLPKYGYPSANISNTDVRLLRKFKRCVGCLGKINGPYDRSKTGSRKLQYTWALYKRDEIKRLAKMLWPYLGHAKRNKYLLVMRERARLTMPPKVGRRNRRLK